ncbi:MAG: imm11 family protein [Bacteroidia bacterium]
MVNAYFLTWKNSNKVASSNINGPSYLIIKDILHVEKLPYEFFLDNKEVEDYLSNTAALPLMSKKMKNFIEENLSGKENITWIEALVNTPSETLLYYLLKFNEVLNVIDLTKTTFRRYPDLILQPVFDVDAIKNICIFTDSVANFPTITIGIFVNDKMKSALIKSKLTGFKFERVAVNVH